MKIIEALRIEKSHAVAIVGAGGKSSLLFALAKALQKPVCLTTTTKLSYNEGFGDFKHLLFSDFENQAAKDLGNVEITLVTNPLDNNQQKWLGLSLSEAELLISTCKPMGVTCLIEADGARRLSLKASAEWEPVIPMQVDLVLVVVGLSAIGKPLTAETVFRPEIFSELTGLPIGETIQLAHVIKMLNHPQGGLKSIPSTSRATVVINQSDAYVLAPGELNLIREALRENYSAAILTSLRNDSEHCSLIIDRS